MIGALFVACAVAFAVLGPSGDVNVPLLAAVLVGYVALWQVDFEVGPAATSPIQIAFVALWFTVPPSLLPLTAASAQVAGFVAAPFVARTGIARAAWGATATLGETWYAFGPALVLTFFGGAHASASHAWIYVLALASQFALDYASNRARHAITAAPRVAIKDCLWLWTIDAALTPLGLTLALAATQSTVAPLAMLPLAAILAQFARERDARILHAVELSSAYRGTARLMGDVLEADDAYTGGEHTQGVVELALGLGDAAGLTPKQMRTLEFGALLHDIGKLRVPNEIINKPGKLTEEEWAVIRQHPGFGQEMLDRVGGELSRVGVVVRAHHERWDGGGYPDGLREEAIPIEARIITICDSYSAMTTDRSYRKGMSPGQALVELERCSGTQFDPRLVKLAKDLLGGDADLQVLAPEPREAPPEQPRAAA